MLLLALAFLQASAVADASAVLSLYRGATAYGTSTSATYQDVEDTYLDKSAPDSTHGGDYTLAGGDGHTILIRFGGLADAIGRNARIIDATLILTPTSADAVSLRSIGTVSRPWGEGCFKTPGVVPKPGVEPPKENPNSFAANWKARFTGLGSCSWQTAGAIGPDVVPIKGAVSSTHENRCEITGLATTVNDMLADPGANNGFALTFSSASEFFSSEAANGKPRLLLTLAPAAASSSADLVVESIVSVQSGYVATVRNRGTEAATGIKAAWSADFQPAIQVALPDTIAPEHQLQVRFDGSVRSNGADHRYGALTLRITDSANDQHFADKQLTVYTSGLPISVLVTRESLTALQDAASYRGRGAANWVQAQLDFVNDVVLARSRYSFATDGCRERVRLAEIKEVGPLVDVSAPIGIPVEVVSPSSGPPKLDFGFIHRLLVAVGAPDLAVCDFQLGSPNVKFTGWSVGGLGPCPDLTGGGDTRYEGSLPRQSLLPEVATFDPMLSAPGLEPTGLLSATGVQVLNALVSVPRSNRMADRLAAGSSMPATVLVSTYEASGSPAKGVELAFFQSHEGTIADQPVFTLSTGDSGTALLPRRKVPGSQVTNAFGSQDFPADGAFLVRAKGPNGVEWGWIKAWQLVDAASRGDVEFASASLYLYPAASDVDRSSNRALNRAVSDSAGSLPAKVAPLVDGQLKTSVELPEKLGDWVEIDLNRDWTLAELRLTAAGAAPWRRFAIKVYQTGQKPANAIDWASEPDWTWSARNRGVSDADGRVSIAYDGVPVQIRYIRIVCLEPGRGSLAQIEAFSGRGRG